MSELHDKANSMLGCVVGTASSIKEAVRSLDGAKYTDGDKALNLRVGIINAANQAAEYARQLKELLDD